MIYLIDNYDSFTYNLYQLIGTRTEHEVRVVTHDALTAAELAALQPDAVVFSPGPGRPENAGNMPAMIAQLRGRVPMFGVCLGMQAMAQAYGATITGAPVLMHGRSDQLTQQTTNVLLRGCPETFTAARYHSLVATNVPETLTVGALGSDGSVMTIENVADKVFGVQFHPESIMTDGAVGAGIIDNFLAQI